MARAADVVGDTCSLLIVRDLLHSPRRFGELENSLSGVSTRTLTNKLKSLMAQDLITQHDGLYALTKKGKALKPVIRAMRTFGESYL